MESISLEDFMLEHQRKAEPYRAKEHEKLVTVSEYAKRTGMKLTTIRSQLERGVLNGTKFGGRWRVIVCDDSHEKDVTIAKLQAENKVLRVQLDCIRNIVFGNTEEQEAVT